MDCRQSCQTHTLRILSLCTIAIICNSTVVQGAETQQATGGSTPQAAYAAYEKANREDDLKVELEILVPKDRDERVGKLVETAVAMKNIPVPANGKSLPPKYEKARSQAEKLLSKYAFDEKRFENSKPKQFATGEAARAALLRKYADTVNDKVAFAAEMKQLLGPTVRQMPTRQAL
jgi:hypothetical protein